MKKLFYRLSSSLSFVKLFSLLACVALGSLFAQQAVAQCDPATDPTCPPPWDLGGFDPSWGGPWGSTISCTSSGNATNVVDFTSLRQTAPVSCTITNGTPVTGMCILDITYSRSAGLTFPPPSEGPPPPPQCTLNEDNTWTLTDVAFCSQIGEGGGLSVTGTLKCNPLNKRGEDLPAICGGNVACTAQLGVTTEQCTAVFPHTESGLSAGQVLSASVTSTGHTCTGAVADASDIQTRFCGSGSFNPANPFRCVDQTGKTFGIAGKTSVFLPIEVEISPDSINVKCGPKKDNRKVNFTIFGSESVDVTLIDTTSLKLEGVPVSRSSCKTGFFDDDRDDRRERSFKDLRCSVPSCPALGPALNAARMHAGTETIEVTVTGTLKSGAPIMGEDTVETTRD